MPATLCSPAAAAVVAAEKAVVAVGDGKVETAVEEKVENKGSTGEVLEAPTRTVVARLRLPAMMVAAPKPLKVVLPK